jgi:hypothetical protein
MTAPGSRVAELMRSFPGWHAWRSSKNRLWATRVGLNRHKPPDLPASDAARWAMTVDADDTIELQAVLAEQERGSPG